MPVTETIANQGRHSLPFPNLQNLEVGINGFLFPSVKELLVVLGLRSAVKFLFSDPCLCGKDEQRKPRKAVRGHLE